jgi:hypothetical protein
VDTSRFVISENPVDFLCGSYGRNGHKTEPFKTETIPKSLFDKPTRVSKSASLDFDSTDSPMYPALVDLCSKILNSYFSSNAERFSFVQACRNVENTERCFDLVMNTLPLDGPFSRDRLYVFSKYWKRDKAYDWNIHFLAKILKNQCKDLYNEHYKLFGHLYSQQAVQQLTDPPTENIRMHHVKISQAKLPTIDLCSSMIIKSPMSTGKTTAIRNLMVSQNFRRVLYISCRRTFTVATIQDFAKLGIEFINYMNSEAHLLDQDYLFVQMESLHRMKPNQLYDLVVLDESETLASILSPIDTHGTHYLQNISTFKNLIQSASYVYAMDAFVGPRTLDLMEALRSGTIEYLENTFQPFDRKAFQLMVEKRDKKTGATIQGVQ